ncbi:MAG TPA: nitroreductase family protein [Bacteroidales bacterium]|nr:nitroreductase family protein [Bacteroidales bacterium]
MDLLNTHRTIRKYKEGNISESLLNKILYSGTRASTTGNMQVYSMVVTQDQTMKEKLSPFHFNQPMIQQAPVVITFCADYNRFNHWCRLRDANPGYDNFLSFITGAIDALLVAQNVCVAAENEGLGICYLGTTIYMAENIIELLELPKGVVPVTTVTLGYPAEDPELTDRIPLEGVVHHEKYVPYTDGDINRLFKEKENLESSKQFVKENNMQSLPQVFTDVRYKKADNETFSKKLLEVIEKQGFMNQ